MRSVMLFGAAALALSTAGAASAATRVEMKDAVVRVVVVPEARSDVKVEFLTTNPALPLELRTNGDKLIVDGGLKRRIRGCRGGDGKPHVKVRGVGDVAYENIPQIVIRTPMNVMVGGGGAVFGSIGRADNVNLDNAGCGDWTIANVNGRLDIDVAGSGDIQTGSASELHLDIAGSGDVAAKAIRNGVYIDIAGSGDVDIASMSGPLKMEVAGSGDVKVASGRASSIDVDVAGSGDLHFAGTAQSLDVSVMGSGDVSVGNVTGPINRSIMGSGSIYVNGVEIKHSRM
ncbi:MAG: GIN domain-containing protein [Caulobacteraceae bacterium]